VDEAVLQSIGTLFAQLNQELHLLDSKGHSLVPFGPNAYYLPPEMSQGETREHGRYLVRRLQHQDELYLLITDAPQARDLLHLAAFGLESLLNVKSPAENLQASWRSLLMEELTAAELEDILSLHGIDSVVPRQVMVLKLQPTKDSDAFGLLQGLVPVSPGDVLIPLDRAQAALVKSLDDHLSQSELVEFARALQETTREETALDLSCGIGETATSADKLQHSCAQALRALALGAMFTPQESVCVFGQMLLPRLLTELQPDIAQYYHSLLFNKRSSHLYTAEMLETIDMFLQKDLNLSDTSRQLYIHRNTLVYRLDKVQRTAGLDLRRFEDAFIFKLFYELRKCKKTIKSDPSDQRKANT
jgi:carbohydrate diacid regulator